MYLHDIAEDPAHIHQCLRETERVGGERKQEMTDVIHFYRQTCMYRVMSVCVSVCLTHAVLHHHKATLVAIEALTLEAARCIHTRTLTT